tara:strand:+ start:1088 stop:1756 length:669 start_codon:yes stop_codon:yes gene_type:complete
MTQSSWEQLKLRSNYHFDSEIMDPLYDTVDRVGQIHLSMEQSQLDTLVEESKEATWRTRGNPKKESKVRGEEEFLQEDFDLEKTGYGKDYVVTNLNWDVPANLQELADAFGLDDMMTRVHVQHPGQVWNLHMDKLEKWNFEDPDTVERYMIQLSDWQPGQWFSYGNYTFEHWKAGDVTTFRWQDVPHSTANAGHYPRITLQVTGVRTQKSKEFIQMLRKEEL